MNVKDIYTLAIDIVAKINTNCETKQEAEQLFKLVAEMLEERWAMLP